MRTFEMFHVLSFVKEPSPLTSSVYSVPVTRSTACQMKRSRMTGILHTLFSHYLLRPSLTVCTYVGVVIIGNRSPGRDDIKLRMSSAFEMFNHVLLATTGWNFPVTRLTFDVST